MELKLSCPRELDINIGDKILLKNVHSYVSGKVYIGCFYNNELISSCFNKFNKECEAEVIKVEHEYGNTRLLITLL